MKNITANKLNRLWKNGIKPIKDSLSSTLKKTDVVNHLLATVTGKALDATQGKILDDKITALNRNSKEILVSGVTLTRSGKHRILHMLNASAASGTATTGLIATLSTSDVPDISIGCSAIVKGSSAANLYVTIDTNGKVMLWNKGTYQSATEAITATIDWYVS